MNPDAALRAAVAAAPDAALPRLVYADFLDDHDHPHHAAALRQDVAMAAERPWADRYWLLKANRDAHTPADFPGDLGWLSDRQPLLVGVPDDWKSRWRAVRAFVSRWWNVSLGDVGRWGTAVEEAERAAGRELPPSVKEWASFSDEMDIMDSEALRDPLGFGRVDAHRATSLLQQAEQDVHWVVRDADLGGDDPPVEELRLDYRGDEEAFVPAGRTADTVSGFVVRYLTWYLPGSDVLGRYDFDHAPAVARLTAELSAGRFDRLDVFERPGVYAAVIRKEGGRGDLHACVRRTVPGLTIPQVLWDFAGPVQEPLDPFVAALGDSANMFLRPRASRPR